MFEWNESIQRMINWIEEHLTEEVSLLEMSEQIGYSPCYCSTRFHEVVGVTLRTYVAGRRLARATIEIRDTDERLLDIAVKYGYSSQEALTRAFVNAYGCTPAVYRKTPVPIVIPIKQVVFFPEHYRKGESEMAENTVKDAGVRVEHIPEHKYIGIWDEEVADYGEMWKKHDCDRVCGVIDSMTHVSHPIVTAHTAGWFRKNGRRSYFYGLGVSADYDGPVPEGFEIKTIPASDYLVFYHPPFDYLKDNAEVMGRVENLAWNFDPKTMGYEWNEEQCQDYQRHYPEVVGYEVLRPVRK